jgi:mono/diheme cytochrome c family protein
VLTGCNAGKNKTNIELIQAMMDQISLKAQDWNPEDPEKPTMLVPPDGTIPIGYKPYTNLNPLDSHSLKNPYSGDNSPEYAALGQKNYQIYCALCHGDMGKGDGQIAPRMSVKPPALTQPFIVDYPDGRLYHVITMGKGVMGSYATQITNEKARWAVVDYMRKLQKKK